MRSVSPLAEVRDVVKVTEALLVFAGEHARLTRRRQRRGFGGELLVKVADVFLADNGGDEGRGHLLLKQRLPVHVLEIKSRRDNYNRHVCFSFAFTVSRRKSNGM